MMNTQQFHLVPRGSRPGFAMRRGLSVLDVLICLAVMALLLALVAPAVHHARERSRSVTCAHNLRQLAVAAHQHLATHRTFPYTSTTWSDEGHQYKAISPHRYLMASLDRVIFDEVDFDDPTDPPWGPVRPAFYSRVNQRLSRLTIPVFACPSDVVTPGAVSYRANLGISVELLAPTSSIEGISQKGAFVNGRSTGPAEFSHGLSNTALFSERVTGDSAPTVYSPFRDVFAGANLRGYGTTNGFDRICRQSATIRPAAHFSFQGASWLLGGYSNSWYNHVRPPNSLDPDCAVGSGWVDGGPSIVAARGLHSGGVNVMLADASVKLISSDIDQNVWRGMGTRSGPPD